MGKGTREIQAKRRERLLRLFDTEYGYEVFDAGKVIFVRSVNGNTGKMQVGIYSQESWAKVQSYKDGLKAESINAELDGQLAMRVDDGEV